MMMMVRKSKGLGERHMKILEFLAKHQDKGYPPSIREIGEETGISSTSVVNYYLNQLEKWGYIKRDRKISRGVLAMPGKLAELSINVPSALQDATQKALDSLRIPMLGRIGASQPMPVPASDFNYYDAEDAVEIASSLLPARNTQELFALQVQGDSMIDAMVNDGDIVIMRKIDNNAQAKNGDMVAIWLSDENTTTLKYFYKEKDGYRLQPANPTMAPIYIEKHRPLEIKGKVVMVIRNLDKRM
jgi:repressor LexA